MDIQALKLELVQQLVSTNDATVLSKVKRLLELLRAKTPGRTEEEEDGLIAAAAIFGQNAYGDDEQDISGLVLKEPNPNYGKLKRAMWCAGPACRAMANVRCGLQ